MENKTAYEFGLNEALIDHRCNILFVFLIKISQILNELNEA